MYGITSLNVVGIPIYDVHTAVYRSNWPYYGNGYIPQAGKEESLVNFTPRSARVM